MLSSLRTDLKKTASKEKALHHAGFFKTGPGQYGEGDVFIGVTVPEIRKVAKIYKDLSLKDTCTLLKSKIHEERLCALFILIHQYKKDDEKMKKNVVDAYVKHLDYVNNWDLVDSSAHKILGPHLFGKGTALIYKLAKSKNMWHQRVAVLTTYHFITQGEFGDILKLSELLLHHEHDLMHKAIGWMLREVGKKNLPTLETFLKKHYHTMPRTMLRYAIEKFPEPKRKAYLKGKVKS